MFIKRRMKRSSARGRLGRLLPMCEPYTPQCHPQVALRAPEDDKLLDRASMSQAS
jgi:hypothetical protein